MTIMEAITTVDRLKPNSYSVLDKVAWLSMLDCDIKQGIIDTHEGGEAVVFHGYDADTPMDTELLVKAPYDVLYVHWLESRIDYNNGEYGRYNNTLTAYTDVFEAFERHYNRTHMPKGSKLKFF